MATHKPITHIYNEINEGKYKSVKHYELKEVKNGDAKLTELINISKDRNCANSMPDFWLKEREGNKWKPYCTTGLFKTSFKMTYKGDKNRKKNLIIFQFSEDAHTLTAHYFTDFYTTDLSKVLPLIDN